VRTYLFGLRCLGAATAIALICFGPTAAVASPKAFDIVSGDAQHSLLEFGRQSEAQILFAAKDVKGVVTNAVHGTYEPIDALHLLLTGTILGATEKAGGVILVQLLPVHGISKASPARPADPIRPRESAQATEPLGASTSDANATGPALVEIIVTATRREERLQDVPISVLAFNQEKMDAEGLHDIDDLARLSPGLNFQRNGLTSSGNFNDEGSDINIRGVDSAAGTSTTGVYVDDTPIQTRHIGFGSVNAFPALFDLDRVEVLRGPQGTLFGAGAEGGVLRFISPEPDLEKISAYSRIDVADTDGGAPSYQGGAAFGAPIVDGVLAFRASVSFERDGGWIDRVRYTLLPNSAAPLPTPVYNGDTTQSNANWEQTTTARLAVKWQVNDSLEITPSIYYQRLQLNDTSTYWMPLSNPGENIYRNGNAGTDPSNDPFTLSAIRLKWNLGFASVFSNTSFYDRNQTATSDYTQYLRATFSSFGELPNTYPAAEITALHPFKIPSAISTRKSDWLRPMRKPRSSGAAACFTPT